VTDRGDHAWFATFYRANYSLILTTCERRLSDLKSAEDATAEVFRVAWERFRAGQELSLPWLYGVARNIVGREYRRSRRTWQLIEAAALAERAGMPAPDRALEVRSAVAQLRRADRELLFMAYWEDLAPIEMAQILGCSVPALWVRLNRARAALRRRLGDSVELKAVKANG
jgi:RNA polymerase sigma factor (sigma-70 family)